MLRRETLMRTSFSSILAGLPPHVFTACRTFFCLRSCLCPSLARISSCFLLQCMVKMRAVASCSASDGERATARHPRFVIDSHKLLSIPGVVAWLAPYSPADTCLGHGRHCMHCCRRPFWPTACCRVLASFALRIFPARAIPLHTCELNPGRLASMPRIAVASAMPAADGPHALLRNLRTYIHRLAPFDTVHLCTHPMLHLCTAPQRRHHRRAHGRRPAGPPRRQAHRPDADQRRRQGGRRQGVHLHD